MNPRPDGYSRIVITGIGAVTNIGCSPELVWDSMRQGHSGISNIEGETFDMGGEKWAVKIGGQIKDWDPLSIVDTREMRRIDRCAILGLDAAKQAITQAGIDHDSIDPTRVGVIIGSGIGGIQTIEDSVTILREKGPHRLNPFTVPRLMVNSCAGLISIKHGLEGPSGAHATACASAGHAIADAFHIIRRGEADVIVTGGTEAACTPLCLGAFMTMKALSTRNDDPQKASRPFDRDRDGFILSEGAGIIVVESEEHAKARGATILAELAGAGTSSDAHHITAPNKSGKGAMNSMRLALKSAECNPQDIDYINAHGTSTPLGDRAEVAAVQALFGDHALQSAGGSLLMSSTKSMHGHCLGASGGVEMIACINAIRQNVAPPTINCDNPDDDFDLDFVPHTAKEATINTVMNNTFGFGGHNVTIITRAYDG
jgi:3-oxoacyl-[acyl-carrier-protein] synthase II